MAEMREEMIKLKIDGNEAICDYNIALATHHLPIQIAKKKLAHTSTARRYRASVYPNTNHEAIKIFSFLRENGNLTTEKSGMQGYSTGMDRPALKSICKDYGLDFFQIKNFVSYYENKMIERQNAMFDSQKEK